MKKVPAIILLIIGNLAAVFIVSLLIMLLLWNTDNPSLAVVAGFVVLAALGYTSSLIYDKFKKKYGLKRSQFILAAYVPLLACSVISLIIVSILDSLHYFKGFLGGLGEFLSSIVTMVASITYLIFGIGFTLSTTKENDDTKG